jgi:integrase
MNPKLNKLIYQYPAPKLCFLRGVWIVKVSIPAHMRHLFGNGSGTTRDRRKSTKTKDYKIAKTREHQLTQVIYDEFDEKLRSQTLKQDVLTDDFAINAITGLASSFKYKDIPKLLPTTPYKHLESLKSACDIYCDLVFNDGTEEELIKLVDALFSEASPQDTVLQIKENLSNKAYTIEQMGLAGRYKTQIVHNFWHDLLLSAARHRGIDEPRIEPFQGTRIPMGVSGGEIVPDLVQIIPKTKGLFKNPFIAIDRPKRVVPKAIFTISSVMPPYLNDMRMKQKNIGTQRKLERWIKQFLAIMGDLEIAEIKPKHGYDYIRHILTAHPTRSNGTLKDYAWGVQNFLKYCVENGLIDTNPFIGLDLSKYGQASEETYPFSREDLNAIFSYDWKPQERLFLSILATTGMRPSEAGNLTWERFNDTEYEGIRFFTLWNTDEERVQVKNQSSKRDIPLHPALLLPTKASGRLFDYRKDSEGLSATAANRIINPILRELVQHPNKSIRSFRRTFKMLLRDLSVVEEVHDAITGHTTSSASRKNYGGMGMRVKFEAVAKLDISFLQQ